jgi:hypothetical protein
LTAGVSRASDILFVQNPKGTSLGIFCDIAFDGIIKLFHPLLERVNWIEPDRINVFHWIAAWIVAFNLSRLLHHGQLPESIEEAFEVIRRMKREGVPTTQVRLQLLALCSSVIDRVRGETEGVMPSPVGRSDTTESR